MNIRQQKYKKNRILGMDMYNAARAAGYAHSYATKACERLEPKMPDIKQHLIRSGLTDKKIAQVLVDAINAEKPVWGDKGSFEPDWQVRLKALELAGKITGSMIQKVEHSGEIKGAVQVVQIYLPAKKEEINGRENRMEAIPEARVVPDAPVL